MILKVAGRYFVVKLCVGYFISVDVNQVRVALIAICFRSRTIEYVVKSYYTVWADNQISTPDVSAFHRQNPSATNTPLKVEKAIIYAILKYQGLNNGAARYFYRKRLISEELCRRVDREHSIRWASLLHNRWINALKRWRALPIHDTLRALTERFRN